MLLAVGDIGRYRRAQGVVLTVALAVAAACGSNAPAPAAGPSTPGPGTPPVVVALGDSLTEGLGLQPAEAYPARLQELIRASGLPHVVVNEGVSGDTTTDGLRRFDRALARGPQVLILALGVNDGLAGVPVATVRRNIETMIERAKAQRIRVLLCGMEAPPWHGTSYFVDFHSIFPDLSRRHDVPLMPFLLTGVAGRAELNQADGGHPNAAGARRIAENMWPYLEPLLR